MNGKHPTGGEESPGRDQGQPHPETEHGEGSSPAQAMEEAQEEAAQEREDERGYQ